MPPPLLARRGSVELLPAQPAWVDVECRRDLHEDFHVRGGTGILRTLHFMELSTRSDCQILLAPAEPLAHPDDRGAGSSYSQTITAVL